MMWIEGVFVISVALTVLSGAAATWLVASSRPGDPSKSRIAEYLARAAMIGALAIFALLGGR
jgi:hypothetical protein